MLIVLIGGQLFGAVFIAGIVVAQFASGLAAQASTSRLLYAMGRDSVLPKAVFGRLSAKFHTPVVNLIVTGATPSAGPGESGRPLPRLQRIDPPPARRP